MEYKEAIGILINLLKKNSLDTKQKEALDIAIGLLSWAALSKSRLKTLKAKRERDRKW